MTCLHPARPALPHLTTGVTVYGCGRDEAAVLRELAPRLGVVATATEEPVSEVTAGLAEGSRCISVGHRTRVTGSALLALRNVGVRYLSTRSIGVDHIDVQYAEQVGISVEGVTYSPDGVADYTLMLMLMALRHARSVLVRADAGDFAPAEVRGRELGGLTVGVVGTGRIGTAVVDRLRGFGCRVLTHDVRPPRPPARPDEHVPLDELLHRSDVVTLHTPLTPDTRHLLDRRRISRMPYGSYVVNTGRGALLDTEALVLALEQDRLGGAALDVLEGEEDVFAAGLGDGAPNHALLPRLQALPNVIVSPHAAYRTDRAVTEMVEGSLAGCVRFMTSAA